MYYLITFAFGCVCGCYFTQTVLPFILKNDLLVERQQDKAIQKAFDLKSNDYTYFHEGEDDFYILTFNNEERRIKFSKNRPYSIIYSTIVDIVPLDTE